MTVSLDICLALSEQVLAKGSQCLAAHLRRLAQLQWCGTVVAVAFSCTLQQAILRNMKQAAPVRSTYPKKRVFSTAVAAG